MSTMKTRYARVVLLLAVGATIWNAELRAQETPTGNIGDVKGRWEGSINFAVGAPVPVPAARGVPGNVERYGDYRITGPQTVVLRIVEQNQQIVKGTLRTANKLRFASILSGKSEDQYCLQSFGSLGDSRWVRCSDIGEATEPVMGGLTRDGRLHLIAYDPTYYVSVDGTLLNSVTGERELEMCIRQVATWNPKVDSKLRPAACSILPTEWCVVSAVGCGVVKQVRRRER